MTAPQNIIAVIFDFDDTLTDDSTTQLLQSHGIDAQEFWKRDAAGMIDQGWDPTLAYLSLMLRNIGKDKPLGLLSNQRLREFGTTLKFYQGLPEAFEELRQIPESFRMSRPSLEIYIISGGLEEIIRGSKIAKYVDGIYGCRFAENNDGVINDVQNVISFTEKTRFIFEINKGIGADGKDSRTNPYQVNEAHEKGDRRIPLKNMIYVGDGLTDVPCFSLIQNSGGQGFGVFKPDRDGSPKQAWQKLLAPRRVMSLNAPKYQSDDELGALLRVAVSSMCHALDLKTRQAVN